MNIADKIDIAADIAGIDLTPATRRYEELRAREQAYRKLRVTHGDFNNAIGAVIAAPADQMPEAWAKAVQVHAAKLAWEDGEEYLFNSFQRSTAKAEEAAVWKALALLTPYIEKLGIELTKLAQNDIDTAKKAISSGHVEQYERFAAITSEFESFAALPGLNPRRREDPALVLIAPPTMPQYERPEDREEEFTDEENRHHEQAVAYAHAGDLPARLLVAARNNWRITPATSLDQYKDRARQVTNGSSYLRGASRNFI